MTELSDLATEAARVLDEARYQTRAVDNNQAWGQVGVVAGRYLPRIVELAADPQPQPPPDPTPEPTVYQGFAVSYSGHDPARDCYLGLTPEQGEWGPHHGLDILAPAPGRVELYTFPTPLTLAEMGVMFDPEYARHHDELFGAGWLCMAPGDIHRLGGAVGQQTMYVPVYWPETPLRLRNGQLLRAAWFGHSRQDVAVGHVDTGGRICTSWDSGVRFEANGITARAAHVHVCGTTTGTLSMNGDVDGLLVAQAFGWHVEWRGNVGPGPTDYLGGGWVAGKRRSAWGGHAIPPVPA